MRKNVFLFLFILAFVSFGAKAQEDGGGSPAFSSISLDNLNYGIKAGATSSYFASNGHRLEKAGNMLGLTVGAFGEYQVTDLLGVTVEVLYAQSGARALNPRYVYIPELVTITSGTTTREVINSNVLIHSIEIPLLASAHLPEMGGIHPKVFGGPSFDFTQQVISYDKVNYQTAIVPNFTPTGRVYNDVTSSFHNFHVGFVLGAGASYDMFTLEAAYKFAFTPAKEASALNNNVSGLDAEHPVMEDLYSRGFSLTLGVNVNELIEKF